MQNRRALLSVFDKSGIVPLASRLLEHGYQLISTGGTAATLKAAALPITPIQQVSGNPESFGGRMKTISFAVEAAILFHRERDAAEARGLGIEPIDVVVCNLYPFRQAWEHGLSMEELMEKVDIGGPTMLRAAAKNHAFVAAICDPSDYPAIMRELDSNSGTISPETRRNLMRKAFNHTADYDSTIAVAMDQSAGRRSIRLAFGDPRPLRYGENSHQSAIFLRQKHQEHSMHDMELLGGKALSYNNIMDIHAATQTAAALPHQACVVVKHTNPCGIAVGPRQGILLKAAWEGDPVSAFGSVIAFNRGLRADSLLHLNLDAPEKRRRKFVEVVAAPAFDPDARAYLASNKNLRIVRYQPQQLLQPEIYQFLPGALLVQNRDGRLLEHLDWVTRSRPEQVDEELLGFGLLAVTQVKSNAIVVVRRREDSVMQLLGMGAGQPNRVDSVRLALERARKNLQLEQQADPAAPAEHVALEMARSMLVSDAFFPFPDNVEQAAAAGIHILVQPGGSIRDRAVIRRCEQLGLSMAMTGLRHFKH